VQNNKWFAFAKDDIESAEILIRENKYNIACFHAQQAAEKALKGFLINNNIMLPRTHNLVELINMCSNINYSFIKYIQKMAILNQFYIATRYPDAVLGIGPDKDTAVKSIKFAKEIFDYCISLI